MKPLLEKLAEEYKGRIDLWEINADANQELVRQLKVYGIPTLVGYLSDKEKVRNVGSKPKSELKSLFESLSTGDIPNTKGLSTWERVIRLIVGTMRAGVAWVNHSPWSVLGIGGVILFSAVYDRCPVWRLQSLLELPPYGTCTPALDGTGHQNRSITTATPMQPKKQNGDGNQNGVGSGDGNQNGPGSGGGGGCCNGPSGQGGKP